MQMKAWMFGVHDTMVEWAGSRDRISLDRLCKVFGIEGKGDITGADVYPMYKEGRIDEISQYCAHDVDITRAVYKRMTNQ